MTLQPELKFDLARQAIREVLPAKAVIGLFSARSVGGSLEFIADLWPIGRSSSGITAANAWLELRTSKGGH